MTKHRLYTVNYTARVSYGEWLSHDEKRISGYSEPKEQQEYYLASSADLAKAHWLYWAKYSDKNRELTLVSVVEGPSVHVLLEL